MTSYIKDFEKLPLPPKTKGYPGLGSLPYLLTDPFGFVLKAREEYGDIYTLDLGLTKVVVLNHPNHAKHVLLDKASNYPKGGGFWAAIRDLVGNGLIVSEGDFWLRQRRLMQPQFHRKRIAELSQLMVEAIDKVYASWENLDDEKLMDITQGFNHLTMSVILNSLFGSALTEEEMNEAAEEMTICLDYMLQGTITHPLPKWLPLPGKSKFEKARESFGKKVLRLIDECRKNKGTENHLLAMLLDVVDAETGEGMTDQQLKNEISTLFIAGYETTSIALSWTVYYLIQHPEILKKLKAEVDEVLGEELPKLEHIAKLSYTKMVFQEVMRIRPPSYWLPRTAKEDDEIDGFKIQAGTNIVSMTFAYHHHPDFWENAESFDPDRFSPEQSSGRHKYAWLPFGIGQRLCIGRDFALVEGHLALAMLVQRFDVKAAYVKEIPPQLATTLRPKGGVPIYIKNRE